MACPLDCGDEHPLMSGTCPRDPLWNDSTLLRHEALEFLFGLVINKIFLIVAEAARALLSNLPGRPTL